MGAENAGLCDKCTRVIAAYNRLEDFSETEEEQLLHSANGVLEDSCPLCALFLEQLKEINKEDVDDDEEEEEEEEEDLRYSYVIGEINLRMPGFGSGAYVAVVGPVEDNSRLSMCKQMENTDALRRNWDGQ